MVHAYELRTSCYNTNSHALVTHAIVPLMGIFHIVQTPCLMVI